METTRHTTASLGLVPESYATMQGYILYLLLFWSMEDSTRRRFLLAVGGVAGLAGCSGVPGGTSDPSEPAGGEPTELTDRRTPTKSDGQSSSGSLTWENDGEIPDRPMVRWTLRNGTERVARTVSINRQNDQNRFDPLVLHRIEPGDRRRQITSHQDAGQPELSERWTWLEGEYGVSTQEVDVKATVRGIQADPAQLEYTVPNPTDMATSDIEQIDTTPLSEGRDFRLNLGVQDGTITGVSSHPLWTQAYESEISGVTNSESFTWTLRPQPSIDVTINSVQADSTIAEPEVTFTAQSASPLPNARVFIHAVGPNISAERSRDRFGEEFWENEEQTLVSAEVGDQRVGQSRTITFSRYVAAADFPLSNDDRLIVGVDSTRGAVAYPVAMVDRPIPELVE